MRINNNIMAMNAHRQLGVNSTAQGKAIEKLSSGFRINRAGDDAAGLAISEKMRGQIRGLAMASRNAQDDISLIQTTEGALNETHDIIQRMREMAVQSANDTNTDDDRAALQNEMDQLAQEVTRIANTTEFNTRKLINGNLDKNVENATGELTFHIGANKDQNMQFSVKAMDAKSLDLSEDIKAEAVKKGTSKVHIGANDYTVTDEKGLLNDYTIKFVQGGAGVSVTATGKTITVEYKDSTAVTAANVIETAFGNATQFGSIKDTKVQDAIKALKFTSGNFTATDFNTAGPIEGTIKGSAPAVTEVLSTTATFDTDGNTKDATVAKGIDISTQKAANTAIKRIDSALKFVSDERAKLGAVQNRLEHTIKNVDTSAENLQASESRIRDVDMAKEMMNYTKQNILNQAAQAMLAQANQLPQGVLQLLR